MVKNLFLIDYLKISDRYYFKETFLNDVSFVQFQVIMRDTALIYHLKVTKQMILEIYSGRYTEKTITI